MNKIQKALVQEAQSSLQKDPVYAKELLNEVIAMDVHLGTEGLEKSWQEDFFPVTTCSHCGTKNAHLAFVASEGLEGKSVPYEELLVNLHDNDPEKGNRWLHDAAAFAVYLCRNCFHATTLFNQA